MTTAIENLGPAERIIQTVLGHIDHVWHNRPGAVVKDTSVPYGLRWFPVTHKEEGGSKVVYRLDKVGRKTVKTRIGVVRPDGSIWEGRNHVADYRKAGVFPEVAVYLYGKIAEVWKLDNEFAARWASFAFKQEHRDLKVILAAFMLVQSRKGDPVIVDGKMEFRDEDFREVGEAMALSWNKDKNQRFDPKMIRRVKKILELPQVAVMNRELGFGKSLRNPAMGRWETTVRKWLHFREMNPKTLETLLKNGFRKDLMRLAQAVHYKPETTAFFDLMRWKQAQAKDGRRELSIGKAVVEVERWDALTEVQICERIEKEKPNFKRVFGSLPRDKFTRAVAMALVEAGSFSDKDLAIHTPTFEELGLMEVQSFKEKWEKALKASEDMRALNIAKNVKSKAVKEKLEEAADTAAKKAVSAVFQDMVAWFVVDVSGSMEGAIEKGKEYIAKCLPAFPADKMHVSVFNTTGREVEIKHASKAGVENAFRGIKASGGTMYAQGVKALAAHAPKADQDLVVFFFGDEECSHPHFANAFKEMRVAPIAFGLVKIGGSGHGAAVRSTAVQLGIPCFQVDEKVFEDPYAIPRTLRNLIASTPVGKVAAVTTQAPRQTLVEQILKTDLLRKPTWAAA